MAVACLFWLCFWLIFTHFLVGNAGAVLVMEQNDPCGVIEGTWALRRSEKDDVSAYFRTKFSRSNILFQTTSLPKTMPFPYDTVASEDPYLTSLSVKLDDFMENVVQAKPVQPDGCILVLRQGYVLVKEKQINTVHIINMNHLDVGFNTNQLYPGTKKLMPGYIINVLNWYFQVYFPRAAKLGKELREMRANETFIYTTHPWLVNLYLDCPNIKLSEVQLECPSEEQLEEFRLAVWMGDIAWHAGPLNQEAESSNPELFAYSLTLSQKLDDYFGLKKTARTLSQRDIPGMTQAVIPYLVQNGIAAVSVGVNPSSPPPDVPSPNVWKFGNYSVITYWHKGGYPRIPGTSTNKPGGLSRQDCQMVDGSDHALCFAFRTDNTGPPVNVQEIKTDFEILRFEFPGANIKASTFESFTEQLLPLRNSLPVVTKEIGDTWIQGAQSDPLKMSHYRTINRLRSECIQTNQCDLNDKRVDDMSRLLVKLPEHTYGLAIAYDRRNWANEDFQPMQYTSIGNKNCTMSWLSHRAFNDLAIAALKNHPLAAKIKAELKKLEPYLPDLGNYEWHDSNEVIQCSNGMTLKVGKNGALTQLIDLNGTDWADGDHGLAEIKYRTYNNTDFDRNYDIYHYLSRVGIFKPGMDYTKAESKFWEVEAHGVYISKTGDPCSSIFVRVLQTDMETWYKYGAPVSYFLKYSVQDNGDIDIDYQFFNKPTTRLPESLLLNFTPKPSATHNFYLHKLRYLVDPLNIVNNGSQYVHGIDEGVWYVDENLRGMVIESLDVGTVLVQTNEREPSPFPTPLSPMKSKPTAMAFNIYNNIWEVNFIFWYPFQPQDKHYKARFRIKFRR